MILLCIKSGDLSPLLPLSWKDCIFLDVFGSFLQELEDEKLILFEDMRFFLSRLSASFTGVEGLNFLPSRVHEMGRRWEMQHPNKE